MPFNNPQRHRDYMRDYMRRRRRATQTTTQTLAAVEVRRMRRAGLSPTQVQDAGSAFAALTRERDALRAALSWRKLAVTPPITESARSRADLESIRRLGEQLRDRDRHYERLLRILIDARELALRQGYLALAARLTVHEADHIVTGALNTPAGSVP